MTYNWTDGPELSILLVRENGRDYAAEVLPGGDTLDAHAWCLYRDGRPMDWNESESRDKAKSDAEHFMSALIEKDFNESMGDTA
jgi:hypothetical protein